MAPENTLWAHFFDLVADYGLMSRSYFSISGDPASDAQAYNPEVVKIAEDRDGSLNLKGPAGLLHFVYDSGTITITDGARLTTPST